MLSPYKVSEDQNTVAHNSGRITKAVPCNGRLDCPDCYYAPSESECEKIPCTPRQRDDKRNVVFKLVPETDF